MMRKKVLGAEHVEETMKRTDRSMMPFQEFLTVFGWGGVWRRPGLSLRTRSLLTLAMCIALNRPNEIKLHLRGAIRNGCTKTEIRELLLHSFIYCGGPAAVDAFNVVVEAFPEIEAQERGNGRSQKTKASARKQKKRSG
jgi:4-carboxymuconolactone decarboxylase